ncbi:MAG TPA: hypothetical protein VMD99_16980 [Terriglobales bacterium]|nr:hypothetical protein [Terriglobales bacterium]
MQRSAGFLTAMLAAVLVTVPCRGQSSPPATNSQADKSGDPAEEEACKLLPYVGTIPLTKLPNYFPDEPDLRGGMICQYRISAELPLFSFHFIGKPDNSLGDIEVTEEPSTTILQTIENSTDWSAVVPQLVTNVLSTVDANFDGYEDLQILSQCGGTGNCTYDFYLYDRVTGQFIRNEFLSSNLCSPEFYDDTKQITTHSHGSASDWQNDTYQYADGRYTLIRQEISSRDDKTENVTVSTYELRNGKMELVNSETEHQ